MKYVYAIIVVLVAGILLALLLSLADRFLKVEEDPTKKELEALLPGVNCGACGYPGCSGLAQAMADRKIKEAKACKVIKGDKAEALQNYLNNLK